MKQWNWGQTDNNLKATIKNQQFYKQRFAKIVAKRIVENKWTEHWVSVHFYNRDQKVNLLCEISIGAC